ncbi:MAG: ABC transporter ATP-binding protein [Psychrosphaera sp.]|nr:ABC transporter ATP-binding protein [Psychrosphaera sp.]
MVQPHFSGFSCQNLSKAYGGFLALDDLNLSVDSGRILGFVGVNGAGKTTALRCMAGIIPPSSGRVKIGDINMDVDAIEAKKISCFVPDTPHLFEYLTVEEHLRFAGRIYSLDDIQTRIPPLLKKFDLQDKANALPSTLSRGMKQKVAICMGFLHDPLAIFLDEPLTGLDPIGIRNMKDAIVSRARQQKAAVIVSSHQLDLIEEICDDIFILDKGKCVARGTLAQLHSQLGVSSGEMSLEALFFKLIERQDS